MGADGPGKCEIAPREPARTHVFCDDWTQASHAGELQHPLREQLLEQGQVTQLGYVLAGLALAVLKRLGEMEGVPELPL